MINVQGSNEVPKVADFLGVGKSENQTSDLVYNEIHANESDYLFTNHSLLPVQNTLVVAPSENYDLPENASNLQSLTLSMGSGKRSTCETTGDNNNSTTTAIVEAATPRRTLDTFGQRTSIYRGVTRCSSFLFP